MSDRSLHELNSGQLPGAKIAVGIDRFMCYSVYGLLTTTRQTGIKLRDRWSLHQLTPWSTVLLEKLIVAQIVKFPSF
jgi:hypothetical protein